MRTIGERSENLLELYQRMGESISTNIRVAMPGIIKSFDSETQTVVVKPTIRERIIDDNGATSFVDLPLLLDVPICVPRSGGFALTIPINEGDECLVVFADMCMDAWWSNGGVQNQIEKRRHDLSDAFAIIGVWSQPNKIPSYSLNTMQLRTIDGSQCIDISQDGINFIGELTHNGNEIGSGTGTGNIDGGSFL